MIRIAIISALVAEIGLSGLTAVAAEIRKPLAYPADVVEPPWVDTRQKKQLESVDQFRAFVGFGFSDRYAESGITFVNISTDDTGKRYTASHYDHGNGVAVADVDGDVSTSTSAPRSAPTSCGATTVTAHSGISRPPRALGLLSHSESQAHLPISTMTATRTFLSPASGRAISCSRTMARGHSRI